MQMQLQRRARSNNERKYDVKSTQLNVKPISVTFFQHCFSDIIKLKIMMLEVFWVAKIKCLHLLTLEIETGSK